MAIEIKLSKSNYGANTIEFDVNFEQTKLGLIVSNDYPYLGNQQIAQCTTIFNSQMRLEYIKTPGCTCYNNKKINPKGKDQKCNCLIPAMFKLYITRMTLPGILLNSCFLISVQSDKLSIHWQKNIKYSDNCRSDIPELDIGSCDEGYIINESFSNFDNLLLFADDSNIVTNPYIITISDSNRDKLITTPTKFIEQKTLINKTSRIVDLDLEEKYSPFTDEYITVTSPIRNDQRTKEIIAKSISNELKDKILQFVEDDKKKEGDVGNGE